MTAQPPLPREILDALKASNAPAMEDLLHDLARSLKQDSEAKLEALKALQVALDAISEAITAISGAM